jgi:cyclic pyranopterin phosphate synthase
VAALTVYDMVKGVERGVEIRSIRLVSKSGGKTGEWHRPDDAEPVRGSLRPGDRVAGRLGPKRKRGA